MNNLSTKQPQLNSKPETLTSLCRMQFLDSLTQLDTRKPTDIVQETILEFIKGKSPVFQCY